MSNKFTHGLMLLGAVCLSWTLSACTPKAVVEPNPTATLLAATTITPQISLPVDLAEDLHIREVQSGVYEVTHEFPWAANSLLVHMPDNSFVWAGSTYTPQAADLVLDWLEENFGELHLIAIDTGYHVDNLGGNAALIARGYPVYGSDLTVQLLKEKGETTRQLMVDMLTPNQASYIEAHQNIPYVPPTKVFPIKEGLHLTIGGEIVQVYYPGPSQAPDKVVVYFPQRKLLFGSCMILSGDQVGNIADADLASWEQAVNTLKQFNVEMVVPGHGDRLDTNLIQHTLDVLQAAN